MNQTPRASMPSRLPQGDDGTESEHESPASRLLTIRSAKPRRYPCPYCGSEESSTTNLWRHMAAKCLKNPNPACDYCGWRYKPGELERHMQRCDYRDNPREPEPHARAEPDDAEARDVDAGKKTPARSTRTAKPRAPPRPDPSPEEDATPADAEPGKTRARRLRGAARRRALLGARPGKPPHPPVHLPMDPILAALALNAEELTRGLLPTTPARRLAEPQEPAPVVTLAPATPPTGGLSRLGARFTENLSACLVDLHKRGLIPQPRSLHEDPWDRFLDMAQARLPPEQMDDLMEETSEWPELTKTIIGLTCQPASEKMSPEEKLGYAVLGGAIVVGAWAVWKFVFAPEPTQPEAPPAPAPAPQYRPPYNPARWASQEHYMAEVGHLSPPPRALEAGAEARVGLDRSASAPPPASASFLTTAEEERARQQREREHREG